ncbi:MAG: Fic family protein [Robiginitomaculum sp.]|nr:Fic family protein [Robiginitomaculum sp.]
MTDKKSPYWNSHSDAYQYPNSTVLRNRFDARDGAELEALELNATLARMPEVQSFIQNQKITFKLWQNIHRILFQDVYEWAGKTRTVQLSKGGTLFAHPEHIQSEADRVFKELRGENYLRDLPKTELSQRLAYYFSECNALHPFREGNGRVQKLLFSELVRRLGYRIEWKQLSNDEHLRGVTDGYHNRFDTLTVIFERIIRPIA